MMLYTVDQMTILWEVSDIAWRMTTETDVGIFCSGWGLMTYLRITSNFVAFLPVPIWYTNTHALDATSTMVGGHSGKGELRQNFVRWCGLPCMTIVPKKSLS